MGLMSRILGFERVDRNGSKVGEIKVDTGGEVNIITDNFLPAGDDSRPLTTDYAYVASVPATGRGVITGFVDPINEGKSKEGEKRIYARDPSDGSIVNEIWLKNDGSVLCSNDNGTFELEAGGDILLNGVRIDPDGNITVPGSGSVNSPSIVVDGKELKNHTHGGVTSGGSNTGPNN